MGKKWMGAILPCNTEGLARDRRVTLRAMKRVGRVLSRGVRCSNLAFRKVTDHIIPTGIATQEISVEKDAEKLEALHTVDGNVKWCNLWETIWWFC